MKYVLIALILSMSACSAYDPEFAAYMAAEQAWHMAEQDRRDHQAYLESVYNLENYDPEYVSDCLFYENLVCEFE